MKRMDSWRHHYLLESLLCFPITAGSRIQLDGFSNPASTVHMAQITTAWLGQWCMDIVSMVHNWDEIICVLLEHKQYDVAGDWKGLLCGQISKHFIGWLVSNEVNAIDVDVSTEHHHCTTRSQELRGYVNGVDAIWCTHCYYCCMELCSSSVGVRDAPPSLAIGKVSMEQHWWFCIAGPKNQYTMMNPAFLKPMILPLTPFFWFLNSSPTYAALLNSITVGQLSMPNLWGLQNRCTIWSWRTAEGWGHQANWWPCIALGKVRVNWNLH